MSSTDIRCVEGAICDRKLQTCPCLRTRGASKTPAIAKIASKIAHFGVPICPVPIWPFWNPADVLTKYLQASTLHKLLPKLGVMTRAVDSKEMLSVLSFDGQVCSSQPTSSFFIGMLSEEPITAQLVASRAYSRRSLPRPSLPEESREAVQSIPRSFTWSSFRWFFVCSAALLCVPFFFQIFDFKLYGSLLSGTMVVVQLCQRISYVLDQVASRTRASATALRTVSSVALGSLRTPKSLRRVLLATFLAAWVALLVQKSLILSASFAQKDSFESSLPSLCLSSFCVTTSSPASERASSRAFSMMSFKHEQVMAILLANEAYSLPQALLEHSLAAKILNKELQPLDEELEPQLFAQFLPKLRSETALILWLIMPESALKAFQASGWDVLPPQKASSRNANLGNWQLSSSASKQISFYAWCSNRAEQLGAEKAYLPSMQLDVPAFSKAVQSLQLGSTVSLDHRGSDCQLVFCRRSFPAIFERASG